MNMLEQAQKRVMEIIRKQEHLTCEEKLIDERVEVFQPEEEKSPEGPHCSLSVLKSGLMRKMERALFNRTCSYRIRGQWFKSKIADLDCA